MGLVISVVGLGDGGAVASEGLHSEAEGYYCGIYCESTHI